MSDTPSTTQQTGDDLDTLLLDSIRRYEDILTLFVAINGDMDNNNPEILHTKGTELLQLQEKAALADDVLLTTMKKISQGQLEHPLLKKRQQLMQQILVHNRSLVSTINNIKSLLAHEIKKMQGGRAALSGYRQTTSSRNGGILDNSL